MPDEKDDREEFERLLRAAHRFANGCEARLSEEQLEKLRQELANALQMMEGDTRHEGSSEIDLVLAGEDQHPLERLTIHGRFEFRLILQQKLLDLVTELGQLFRFLLYQKCC
jgi:hypothetical protein